MTAARPSAGFAFSHPAHAIALGFGAGLSPLGPGTAGTLVAWPLGWYLSGVVAPSVLVAALAIAFAAGMWACELTGRHLGVADHGAMVWDEIVAFLLVLAIVPRDLAWQAAAFVLFRAFDIGKPPPIDWFERRLRGGFGVMFDDLLAAGYTLVCLAAIKRLLG
ncbi:MAG TPA: phosphatidylglycerophosphatase A [Burkholderiales bacterium]|nr:phosphatidylglycerophosphatase A [Burkholderiales bacterium]